jgi:hypothetical protein
MKRFRKAALTGGRPGSQADDTIIAELVEELQLSGIAAPSTARINGRLCVRAAIVNHRTGRTDIDIFLKRAEGIAIFKILPN